MTDGSKQRIVYQFSQELIHRPAQGQFAFELVRRVERYFKTQSKRGVGPGLYELTKGLLLLLLQLSMFNILVWTHPPVWLVGLLVLNLSLVLLAFRGHVLHEAIHGTFSKFKQVNRFLAYVSEGRHLRHHKLFQLEGWDPELPSRHLVTDIILNGFWFIRSINESYFCFVHLHWMRGITLFLFVTTYCFFTIYVPIQFNPTLAVLVTFCAIHVITGALITWVSRLSHRKGICRTLYPLRVGQKLYISESWIEHRLKTTSNFSKSIWFEYFLGGMCFPIEHSLFPNSPCKHLRPLSEIIRATCEEFGVPYSFVGISQKGYFEPNAATFPTDNSFNAT